MQWHQERQRVLAENVANAETPHYRARDLAPPNFASALQRVSISMARTDPGHVEAVGGSSQFEEDRRVRVAQRSATKRKCSSSPATRRTMTR